MTGAAIAVSVGCCLLEQRVTAENSCFLLLVLGNEVLSHVLIPHRMAGCANLTFKKMHFQQVALLEEMSINMPGIKLADEMV
jgi:hypothetical protein